MCPISSRIVCCTRNDQIATRPSRQIGQLSRARVLQAVQAGSNTPITNVGRDDSASRPAANLASARKHEVKYDFRMTLCYPAKRRLQALVPASLCTLPTAIQEVCLMRKRMKRRHGIVRK